ncbi:MAG: DUF1835 domain-containing protein [Flavobacteriales bacterium]|nr:DUF1835 domain-containing protein [Flavobacteriales bacterium]MCB9447864.1 DUF1835 domain-containing protein [Flavobacteriales bacterium]
MQDSADNIYHILNGDVLKEYFPDEIVGRYIVMRECLVVGPTPDGDLDDFFKARAAFLHEEYSVSPEEYERNAKPELLKIATIPPGVEVNMWFEDDLFCQVNMWFACSLLCKIKPEPHVFLVRPEHQNPYQFSCVVPEHLPVLLNERISLPSKTVKGLADLWGAYQTEDRNQMEKLAKQMGNKLQFLEPAVEAHLARLPQNGKPGRPEQVITEILERNPELGFESVFRLFQSKEAIYGYGDLQVKSIYNRVKEKTKHKK